MWILVNLSVMDKVKASETHLYSHRSSFTPPLLSHTHYVLARNFPIIWIDKWRTIVEKIIRIYRL